MLLSFQIIPYLFTTFLTTNYSIYICGMYMCNVNK
uniref:PBP-dependent ABC transporter-like protein n=1 Tax=Myoviridae sp. ctuev19 TaxID=2827716 RepID=A0A8S5SF65_9CAUD|nr:MAG TPA: PBP-dependent ABC transporter-like protein [Myoviridae sp. ctuev19]DAU77848.1 MAG TPA: PBP-dependent ABC transporter [Ackermannviridae sp.]